VSKTTFEDGLVFGPEQIEEITKCLEFMRRLGKGKEVIEDDDISVAEIRL
jgi:hypothetical protein